MMKTIRKVILVGWMPSLCLVQVAKSETVSESERTGTRKRMESPVLQNNEN